jgi:multimeric flavodoxin WrbA
MAKKILIVTGSPNKHGNTAHLVAWAAEGARKKGAEVEIVDVAGLQFGANGCTACMGCQKLEDFQCVIKDQASVYLAKIPQMDVLVLATPLYLFGPSAQLKLFMDRMYSLFKFDRKSGAIRHNLHNKILGLIASAGGELPCLLLLEQSFKIIAEFSSMRFESLLVPHSGASGVVKNNKEAREQAVAFGSKLAS